MHHCIPNIIISNSHYLCVFFKIVLFFAVAISMVYAASVDTSSLSLKDADRLGILFNANQSRKPIYYY
jgi:hypothetical protein